MPSAAVIYWQHNIRSGVKKAEFCDVVVRRDIDAVDMVVSQLPRLEMTASTSQRICLSGDDVKQVKAPYPAPIASWCTVNFHASFLAREYFRRDSNDDKLLAFRQCDVALGRSLVMGESVVLSSTLPPKSFLDRVSRWGAKVMVKDFICS